MHISTMNVFKDTVNNLEGIITILQKYQLLLQLLIFYIFNYCQLPSLLVG